jgi:hypothetical protein
MNLSDADTVLLTQVEEDLLQLPEVHDAASGNDREQFGIYLEPRVSQGIVTRHSANADLLAAFFDKPGVGDAITTAIIDGIYERLRDVG